MGGGVNKVIIQENRSGEFHLEGFGQEVAGANGLKEFRLVIESEALDFRLEFPLVTAFDLFTKLDLGSPEFIQGKMRFPSILKVKVKAREVVIEAATGSLYDLLKERGASGDCVIHSRLPVAFFWSGNSRAA